MKLPSDDEGVSEVLGYVIILGIVLTAIALVIVLVFPAIQNTKDNGQLKEVQQGFTVVDSRLSKARFSTSIFQEAPFKISDGTVTVDESYDNSHIIVTEDPGNIQLYPNPSYPDPKYGTLIPLGTIRFVNNNQEIGYQGGGVWALYDRGLSTERCEMISPPDFDYNTVTLTLPITRIVKNTDTFQFQGADVVSGKDSTLFIDSSSSGTIELKFPDPNGVAGYTNPLEQQGNTVKVTIKSDYYMGWYSYFKERGLSPKVYPDIPEQKTVVVELSTGNGRQETHLINNGGSDNNFNTKHMETSDPAKQPIEIFQIKMVPFNPGEGNTIGNAFRVSYDSICAPQNPRLQIYVGRHTPGEFNKEVADVIFTYTYTNADGTYTEVFKGYAPFQRKGQDEFTVDLLNTNIVPETATDNNGNTVNLNVMEYYPDPGSPHTSVSWGSNWDSYDAGSEVNAPTIKSLYDVTQHYMWIMGNAYPYDPTDPNSGPVYKNTEAKHLDTTGASKIILQYSSDEQIKYLYITEGTLTTGVSSKSS